METPKERIEYHLNQIKAITNLYCLDDADVSRLEVIGPEGREYVRYFKDGEFMRYALQDDDRTLKVFIENCA